MEASEQNKEKLLNKARILVLRHFRKEGIDKDFQLSPEALEENERQLISRDKIGLLITNINNDTYVRLDDITVRKYIKGLDSKDKMYLIYLMFHKQVYQQYKIYKDNIDILLKGLDSKDKQDLVLWHFSLDGDEEEFKLPMGTLDKLMSEFTIGEQCEIVITILSNANMEWDNEFLNTYIINNNEVLNTHIKHLDDKNELTISQKMNLVSCHYNKDSLFILYKLLDDLLIKIDQKIIKKDKLIKLWGCLVSELQKNGKNNNTYVEDLEQKIVDLKREKQKLEQQKIMALKEVHRDVLGDAVQDDDLTAEDFSDAVQNDEGGEEDALVVGDSNDNGNN